MVRGNWQKRVETAEARRHQARQRKQRSEAAATHKQQAADLVRHLQQQAISGSELIFYTDTPPPPLNEDGENSNARKQRSSSWGQQQPTRSAEKKKVHPRSRANSVTAESSNTPHHKKKMCRSFFFTGKCSSFHSKARNKSRNHLECSCQWGLHLDSLVDVVAAPQVADAATATTTEESMDCIVRVPGSLRLDTSSTTTIGDQLATFLSAAQHNCKLSNVVYVVSNSSILFDRHRGGWLATETTTSPPPDNNDANPPAALTPPPTPLPHLPSVVVEHVALFLPDSDVGILRQVCRSWYTSIGTAVWRHLLERNHWPLPSNEDRRRVAFVSHTTVVRDVRALLRQLPECTDDDGSSWPVRSPNDIPSLGVWSPGVVWVAHCTTAATIALYRQPLTTPLLCRSVDPYANTKRRTSQLLDVAHSDDEWMGCLYSVTSSMVAGTAHVLALVARDELGCVDSGKQEGVEFTAVLDVGQCVLKYLLLDDGDDDDDVIENDDMFLLRLMDFVARRGIGEVVVNSSNTIAALGHGRFLLYVKISFRDDDEDGEEEDEEAGTEFSGSRFVIFSVHAEAVVWTSPKLDGMDFLDAAEDGLFFTSFASNGPTFAAGTAGENRIAVGVVDDPIIFCSMDGPAPPLTDDWVAVGGRPRHTIVTTSNVVTAEAFWNAEILETRSVVRVYPLEPQGTNVARVYVMEGNLDVKQLSSIRNEHVVLICRGAKVTRERNGSDPDGNAIEIVVYSTVVVILHVETGAEVMREELDETLSIAMIPNGQNTLAMATRAGFAMTGQDIRDQQYLQPTVARTPSSSSKKKKKRQPNRGGKKDGFARGMSLRG